MPYITLDFSIHDAIATVTLNRPDAANSLNMAMGKELMNVAIRCDQDPAIRVVVLTGTGQMFCAGGDLKSFAAMGDDLGSGLLELTTYFHTAIIRFTRMSKPLIVAVNGTAAGAGVSLAAAGDITLASDSARFTLAYTAAGLSPDGSSSYFLPRLIGLRRTQELILTNRRLSAAEAADWGLITRAVKGDDLVAETNTLAEQMASGPTQAFAKVKELLAQTFQNSLETQLDLEGRSITALANGADARGGIHAFANKQRPSFNGQS